MAQIDARLTTGLGGLDRMLKGLICGDNIVWHVDDVNDYRPFVRPFCRAAGRIGEPLIYLRFATHRPLVPPDVEARVCRLDPSAGFETFITSIHRIIEQTGRGGYFVFDCISDLAEIWGSDQMLGNFFMLTCPYLYDTEAIAYFALRRNAHSFQATRAIAETTQVFLDVCRYRGQLYIQPWKAQSRHSATMHMLHVWTDADFRPVTDSITITEVRHTTPWLQSEVNQAGLWDRTFARATELTHAPVLSPEIQEERRDCFHRLLRMCISRDERILKLAEKYLTLPDVVRVGKRMIGTGLIGGKSVGMLLARSILTGHEARWEKLLEPHDSFYVASDVFYTYLVRNGIWTLRERTRSPESYLKGAERARQRMLIGAFPDSVGQQFEDMLDYFGQSPIIVRSSSLMEDNYGNAFAGKYESVFCVNQGSRHQRLQDFLAAVRTIYASTMSERALTYRAERGMLDRDEQMALLVQRVSGQTHAQRYFPLISGVGFSFNPYVWSPEIDPAAGMMRIVFGLGTRAVDRRDDDYTRLVALNRPLRRPEENLSRVRQFSQRRVDVLDLTSNQLVTDMFRDVVRDSDGIPLDLVASPVHRDEEPPTDSQADGSTVSHVLTFDDLFRKTRFVEDMREMLRVLHEAYEYPVDVEFTANMTAEGYRINVVQCRPLQVRCSEATAVPPSDLPADRVVLKGLGPVIGQSLACRIDRILYVSPAAYQELSLADRYALARLVGRVCRQEGGDGRKILLIGPGRWGTTTPSLGVPVRFAEINRAAAICEYVGMSKSLTPDVSLGTHFFSDLIETEILYFALFPDRDGYDLNMSLLDAAPSLLESVLSVSPKLVRVLRLLDADSVQTGASLVLNADSLNQRVICYFEPDS